MVPGAHPPAAELGETDVLIIGGGIMGCSLAYYLARDGATVTLIDRSDLNTQASGGNAGSLHVQTQVIPAQQAETDPRWVRIVESNLLLYSDAVRTWQALAAELDTDIEIHVDGGLMVAESDADVARLKKKVVRERALGLEVELLSGNALRARAPYLAPAVQAAEFCPLEGRINPLLATPAVARAAARAGARLIRHMELIGLRSIDGGGFVARTAQGTIRARRVVNAAGPGGAAVAAMVGVELPMASPNVLQVNVTEPLEFRFTELIQHASRRLTFKQATNGNLIIGGGWDGTGEPEPGRHRVLRANQAANLWTAMQVIPDIAHLRLLRTWTAINANIQGGPILGPVARVPGYYHALFNDSAYTAGPICAKIVQAMMQGTRPPIDLDRLEIVRVE